MNSLNSTASRRFLTDGGIETTLIFDDGLELPHFAAIHLMRDAAGRAALRRYYERYIRVALDNPGFGFILESPTWRSSADWGDRLGYSKEGLRAANIAAIALMIELRTIYASDEFPMLVSACVGPRGDGYVAGEIMRAETAEAYHDEQIGTMLEAGADLVSAITMTNTPEAIGIVRAAKRRGATVVISFTVETDGNLPTGQSLRAAIDEVDAATGHAPAYYMINCAHPSHFADVLDGGAPWTRRVQGIRANASKCSHAELNEARELDRGEPSELVAEYGALAEQLPQLRVFGGCCGTNHEHVEAIAASIRQASAARLLAPAATSRFASR
jgi:S-methylmethionine-dependent homocysteine/selenocysteine methylase